MLYTFLYHKVICLNLCHIILNE
uniref:Uncharacterized protein n=1 Tax=Arundo donax TaxID=35708 RepID=A0A0A9BG86_ARUDO